MFATIAVAGLAAVALYPWIAHPLYHLWTPAVEGFGAAGLTVLVCLAVVARCRRGTRCWRCCRRSRSCSAPEVGLELLQLVYAVARTAGMSADDAYGAIFIAQVGFAAVALALIGVAIRRARRIHGRLKPDLLGVIEARDDVHRRLSARKRAPPNRARSAHMIGALRSIYRTKSPGRPKIFVLTAVRK